MSDKRYLKCPICKKVMDFDHSVIEGGFTAEDHIACPNGCYEYHYTYGSTQYVVGMTILGFYYSDSEERKKRVARQIRLLIIFAKISNKLDKILRIRGVRHESL